MSEGSDWRHRRSVHGREHLGRPGQPPADGREPGDDLERELGAPGEESLDLSEVGFDENFLDALSRDVPVPTRDGAEYELAELLSGWRNEVVSTPTPQLVSVDDVERAIERTERASRGRRMVRHLRVVSGAAAIVIVAAAGLTVLSEGSQPGDPLWGVKQVVFAEAASETQAAYDVRNNLESAEAAIAAGDTRAAASFIAKAQGSMGPMRDKDTREEMSDWMNRLRAGAGLPTTRATTSTADQSGPAVTEPGAPTSPDVRNRTEGPSPSDVSVTTTPTTEVPGPVEEPGQSEEPVPSSPPSEPTEETVPPTSSSMSRTPADFPAFPWTPPPGVDASDGRPR
ncbi:anti-sigma-D factor RsdA [Gordonia westfalica]|uniref:Anti-sigma-D factor RsdA to sigma factor binding region n=1 Tax=Gordonia westfalica TaxID=158898 RepID=A0A1H2JBF3_9ACTN|nr:anti-sigma-D factor RsdA [Gordonia westfalica]SDU53740.1 Anti-sigma-D factor RsdA to sigma factor binding region [Gordonia westfalica]